MGIKSYLPALLLVFLAACSPRESDPAQPGHGGRDGTSSPARNGGAVTDDGSTEAGGAVIEGAVAEAGGAVIEGAVAEAGGAVAEAGGAVAEADGAVTEAGGAVTEAGGAVTEAGGAVTEAGGAVTDAEASAGGPPEDDALSLSGGLAQVVAGAEMVDGTAPMAGLADGGPSNSGGDVQPTAGERADPSGAAGGHGEAGGAGAAPMDRPEGGAIGGGTVPDGPAGHQSGNDDAPHEPAGGASGGHATPHEPVDGTSGGDHDAPEPVGGSSGAHDVFDHPVGGLRGGGHGDNVTSGPGGREVGAGAEGVGGGQSTMAAACGEGFYAPHDDRAAPCMACTGTCAPGATETRPCTPSADRACEPCPRDGYDHDGDAATACRACDAECGDGTTETATCSPTGNRVCTACGVETYDHDGDASTPCMPCGSVCDHGFTETVGCTPTVDRVCVACAQGTYDHDGDPGSPCETCVALCADGFTENAGCSATTDRVCTACAQGTYDHDGDAHTACVACEAPCGVGSTQTAACTPTSNRGCEVCPHGAYDHDRNAQTACLPCTATCPAGTTQLAGCTATGDLRCEACPGAAYDDDANPHTPCVPCTASCDEGRLEVRGCTPSSDRLCGGCMAGYFEGAAGCTPCGACAHGETRTAPCAADRDTQCAPCAAGTVDHDADGRTGCIPCRRCGADRITFGTCTATSDINCAPCGTNPSGVVPHWVDAEDDPFRDCPPLDPYCEETIDILVLYTPALMEGYYGGDVEAVAEHVNYWFYVANQSTIRSFFNPLQRYRLVGLVPFPYQERGKLKSDLIWLRHNPYFQALRKSYGADVGVFILGTSSYGGFAYSNSGLGIEYDERGVVVMDGYFLTDEFDECGTVYQTPAHELGHILGAGHLGSQFANPLGPANGYHNQEPNFRRQEAFGLPVDQHDLKFFSLMSYAHYMNEYGVRKACNDCVQLPVFSSPDLWWFFDVADPLHGYCLVVEENGDGTVDLTCEGPGVWTIVDGRYVLDGEAVRTLPAQDIIDRAVPVGVDDPAYTLPDDPQTTIQMAYQTRNRDRAMNFWSDKADNAAPIAPSADCPLDCAVHKRVGCAAGTESCGGCLPSRLEVDGSCVGRLEVDTSNPLHDERYANSGVYAMAGGGGHGDHRSLGPGLVRTPGGGLFGDRGPRRGRGFCLG